MRALQMDPVNGAPQKWAQNCFYMCTYATLAQMLIPIAVTLVLSGTSVPNPKVEEDMTFKVENKALGAIQTVGRFVIMFCIYVGFLCVIKLTFQFSVSYIMIFICITIDELPGMKWQLLIKTHEE